MDIIAFTENLHSPHDTTCCISDICPWLFLLHTCGRGGVGILVSNKFKIKCHYVQIYSSFEAVCIEVSNCSITGYFLSLYRPPGITSSFFVDFHDLLENLVTIHPEVLILGDFNLHLDTHSNATSTFNDILASFDLKQHVSFSTHIHGNCHRWFIGSFDCHSRNKT